LCHGKPDQRRFPSASIAFRRKEANAIAASTLGRTARAGAGRRSATARHPTSRWDFDIWRLREALFVAGSAGLLAKQIHGAAGGKQNRPAVWRPDRESVGARMKGEPAENTALDFQQPEIGAAGRVTRDRGAAAVRRKTTSLASPADCCAG